MARAAGRLERRMSMERITKSGYKFNLLNVLQGLNRYADVDEILNRLASYEDTELEPEEINEALREKQERESKPISNADRTRGMTDGELQKFLHEFESGDVDYAKTFCDLCCKDAALKQRSTDCDGCLLWWLKNDATLPQGIDWLKQPVKEE